MNPVVRLKVRRGDGHRYSIMAVLAEESHCQHGSTSVTRWILSQPDARLESIEVVEDAPGPTLPEQLVPPARELLVAFSEWAADPRQAGLMADENWTWTEMIDAFIAEATIGEELRRAAERDA